MHANNDYNTTITKRNDIASCSEKAYTSLPLSDAATLLYFNNEKEVLEFAKEVIIHDILQYNLNIHGQYRYGS